ncbi:MAG: hypothetical protein HDT38_06765 [Clostridiales bacterium]|nr:hypothetical protein [Clostridiales bacterium]
MIGKRPVRDCVIANARGTAKGVFAIKKKKLPALNHIRRRIMSDGDHEEKAGGR